MIKDKKRDKINSQRYASCELGDEKAERLPSLKKYSTISNKKDEHFDKYYIVPNLRYKIKSINPKNSPLGYQDETYVYKNMHNNNFWNWSHPLDGFKLRPEKNSIG